MSPWAFFLLGSSVPIPLTNQTPETRCVEWGQEATAASLAHTRDPELGQGCCCTKILPSPSPHIPPTPCPSPELLLSLPYPSSAVQAPNHGVSSISCQSWLVLSRLKEEWAGGRGRGRWRGWSCDFSLRPAARRTRDLSLSTTCQHLNWGTSKQASLSKTLIQD